MLGLENPFKSNEVFMKEECLNSPILNEKEKEKRRVAVTKILDKLEQIMDQTKLLVDGENRSATTNAF